MIEIKFRVFERNKMSYWGIGDINGDGSSCVFPCGNTIKLKQMQYIGLKDKEGKEFYHYDIAEFQNGDRFIVLREDWLEFYVEYIGEPKCEDQARDLYRISKAKIIGNKFENPELLKDN